jgi:hypothetical protein
MARAQKSKRPADEAVVQAAIDAFAARSHDAWRRSMLKTNPEQRGKPRMRLRGGVMVDVNQPWSKLHPKAKADNLLAARDAYKALERFPRDREAASAYVHTCWVRRNKSDPSQPRDLFRPYGMLPEVEKDKDRAHVDQMKAALRLAGRKTAAKKPRAAGHRVAIDQKRWARLVRAAKALSKSWGREVGAEALMLAGIDAIIAVTALPKAKSLR